MMDEALLQQIQQMVMHILSGDGLVLVHFRLRRQRGTVIIEVLADRPSGGITIEQCSAINKKIVNFLEHMENFTDDYEVDVSSPGIDWPLKGKNDFLRVLNHDIRVFLTEPLAPSSKSSEAVGRLMEVGEDSIMLMLASGKKTAVPLGEENNIQIPLVKIKHAVQVI